MKVFIIGGAGGIGRRLASLAVQRDDEVVSMHRNPAQTETVRATGATSLIGDLVADSVEELARRLTGADAVVFSAGAHGTGFEHTTAIDGDGLEKAAAATARAGVSRFILVSAMPEAGRDRETTPRFEHYIKVKKTADVHLVNTDLDWLIIRPGTLTDEPGTGRVTAGLAVEYDVVPRDDVAAFIAAASHEPRLNRVIVELTTGDTVIPDAIGRLTSRR